MKRFYKKLMKKIMFYSYGGQQTIEKFKKMNKKEYRRTLNTRK